jgi:hypothetical protein
MEYKAGFIVTGEFDVRPEEISSVSIEGVGYGGGVAYELEITTKRGVKLTYPNPPAKTREEVIEIKQKLNNEIRKHNLIHAAG